MATRREYPRDEYLLSAMSFPEGIALTNEGIFAYANNNGYLKVLFFLLG